MTERQLRMLIKEEIKNILNENLVINGPEIKLNITYKSAHDLRRTLLRKFPYSLRMEEIVDVFFLNDGNIVAVNRLDIINNRSFNVDSNICKFIYSSDNESFMLFDDYLKYLDSLDIVKRNRRPVIDTLSDVDLEYYL